MDTALLTITVIATAFALAMSVVAWRSTHEEKMRAAARVATLSAAANTVDQTPPPAEKLPLQAGFLGATTAAPASASHQRTLTLAALVLLASTVTFGLVTMTGGAKTAAPAASAPPLELISLQHERQGGRLSVSGLVRNLVNGAPLARVSAVVSVFDAQGRFVSSGTALLDFVTLGDGDESPFVVTFDAPQSVARYRVSFRTEGGAIAHVDRRTPSQVASQDANGPATGAK